MSTKKNPRKRARKEILTSSSSQDENFTSECESKSSSSKKSQSAISGNDDDDEVSQYEILRQKNIEKRQRLFNELQIGEAVQNLAIIAGSPKASTTPASKRGLPARKKIKEGTPQTPERKSLRLQRIDADTGLVLPEKEPKKQYFTVEERPRPPLDDLSIRDVADWRENSELDQLVEDKTSYLQNLKPDLNFEEESGTGFEGDLAKIVSKLKISAEQVAKVTPSRIFSMAIHPTESKLLVAAGDKWGAVGLWDVNNSESKNSGVEVFYPHSRPINCLTFNTIDPNQLISTSYDGTVRYFDLEAQKVGLIYGSDDEEDFTYTGYHYQVDAHTYLISLGRTGIVGLVDTRESNRKRSKDFQVYERVSARMASLHPTKRHLLMAPNTKGECCIFDIRSRQKKLTPVVSMVGHSKALSSAMFSSVTGNSVVTVCYDNKLRIYDTTKMEAKVFPKKQISHNNQTGQWLTTFKAEWHPRRDDVFFVGSMSYPRQIDVYKPTGEHFPIRGEELTSICSIVKAHPTQDIVVGGNSSGRAFAFK